MRNLYILLFLLVCNYVNAQNFFINKKFNIPGSPTPGAGFYFSDFDHDNFKEMMSVEYNSKKNILIYGNTNGVMDTVPVVYQVKAMYAWITDWNHDGWDDILYAIDTFPGISYSIMLNNHLNGFSSPTIINGAQLPWSSLNSIRVTDVNFDLYPDIVTDSSSKIVFMINNAGNSFVTRNVVNVNSFSGFNVLDVDGDNKTDLAVFNNQYCFLYRHTGSFQFTLMDTVAFTNTGNISSLDVFNIDNSSTSEIVAITDWDIFIAQKTSGWQFNQFYTGNFQFQEVGTAFLTYPNGISDYADVDGNGYKDIVAGNSVFYVNGLSLSKANILTSPDCGKPHFSCVDSDNNGTKELWWNMAEYYYYGDASVFSVAYAGSNSFSPRIRRFNAYFNVINGENGVYSDFDNDGDRDYLYGSPGKLMIGVNDGNNHFQDKEIINYGYESVSSWDYDNDGLPDLLCTVAGSPGHIVYAHNNGNLQFTVAGTLINNSPWIVGFKDFDNDGYEDVLYMTTGTSSVRLNIIKNTAGVFQDMGIIHTTFPIALGYDEDFYFEDFNNDSLPDLFYYLDDQLMGGTGRLVILVNAGNFIFNSIFDVATSNNSDRTVGYSDVNGDGLQDLLYVNQNVLRVFKNTGMSFSASVPIGLGDGGNSNSYFTIDVNNDGLNDIISFNGDATSDFKVSLNTGNGFSPFVGNGHLTIPSYDPKLQLVDYDNDGDMDFLDPWYTTIYENTATSLYSIVGKVFYDVNGNGVINTGDISVSDFPVSSTPGIAMTYSDTTGDFILKMGGETGTFAISSLSPLNPNITFTTTPYPASATLSTSQVSDTVLIGFRSPGGIHQATLDLSISRHRCNQPSRLWISSQNFSPLSSNFTFNINLPAHVIYQSSSIVPVFQSGQQASWTMTAAAFAGKEFWMDVMMPPGIYAGDTVKFFTELHSVQGIDTIIINDTLSVVLTCSFDPNQKMLIPLSTQLYKDTVFAFDDYIEYQVDFQNTGSDTAINVNIKDLLPTAFDSSSWRLISSSHPCEFYIDLHGELNVRFVNIMLPDSNVDYKGSMGYVKFSAQLKPGRTRANPVSNNARIYFDDNTPVLTNVVVFRRANCRDFNIPKLSSGTICAGQEYSGTVNSNGFNATYTWNIDGAPIGVGDTLPFMIINRGNHVMLVHIDLGVCQSDTSFAINISDTVPIVTINHMDTTICPNSNVQLTTNHSDTYWYVNGTYSGQFLSFNAHAGDSITVTHTTNLTSCTGSASTVVHNLFPSPYPLLTNVPFPNIYACELDTMQINGISSQLMWRYRLNNYPADLFDTASFIRIYADSAANFGTVWLTYDTGGCHFASTYSINIVHSVTDPLPIDTGQAIICPHENASYWFNCDSVILYRGANYYSTHYQINDPLEIDSAETYTANMYRSGCMFTPFTFDVTRSMAPFPSIQTSGNWMFTSDGSNQRWLWSTDSVTWNYLGNSDSISIPTWATYFRLAAQNSDGCIDSSDIFSTFPVGTQTINNRNGNIYFDQSNQILFVRNMAFTGESKLQVYDLVGKLISETKLTPENKISGLLSGIYLFVIRSGRETSILKVGIVE